ncbi:ferredoxin [Phytohabitans kaempferiae]|uniref:Ferredoxin n=1 Tax=Phytohabitans kaempferiae TaxID=1620943 RepID=A0ABV6M5K6_9ACTN
MCIGSGNCEFVAPRTFRIEDDGISRVVSDGKADGDDTVTRAIDECPAMAIRRAEP